MNGLCRKGARFVEPSCRLIAAFYVADRSWHNHAVPKPRKSRPIAARFSIAEWYGTPLTLLTADERRALGQRQSIKRRERPPLPCPFKPGSNCSKDSGVCTLRLYTRDTETGLVTGTNSTLRTSCPTRFEENKTINEWVGETVLDCHEPLIIREVGFLDPPVLEDGLPLTKKEREVGRIDNILMVPDSKPLAWCALEFQSVYFSGDAMSNEFELLRDHRGDDLPFPAASHRPDNRSSGPKRLMPQLQTKVPSLRRWGKKMAVIAFAYYVRDALGKCLRIPARAYTMAVLSLFE